MKLNAICIVKNEADILPETLDNALRFCDNIYMFDNGSDDGTWEQIQTYAARDPRVKIAERSSETYRNQLRNRVYNEYNHLFSEQDWWYILDADELILDDPRDMLNDANKKGCDWMRVWQAQFYFTDIDMAQYEKEDKTLPVTQRRLHYRVNWREARFFRNVPNETWSEQESGRIPARCEKVYADSPLCCHYAERTPEQIQKRIACRKSNPFSFLHVKNRKDDDWIKPAAECHTYTQGGKLRFSFWDKVNFYQRSTSFWCEHRLKNLSGLVSQLKPTS